MGHTILILYHKEMSIIKDPLSRFSHRVYEANRALGLLIGLRLQYQLVPFLSKGKPGIMNVSNKTAESDFSSWAKDSIGKVILDYLNKSPQIPPQLP